MADDLTLGDWGWQVKDGKYLPIQTDKPSAPASLLKVIRCGCKNKKDCATKKCTYRKYGLQQLALVVVALVAPTHHHQT